MTRRTHARRLPIAVQLGIPIVVVTVATSVLLGFLGVQQAIRRVDDSYRADADDVMTMLADRFPTFPEDPSEINSYLAELSWARPSITRVQLIREGALGNPFVWASSLPSDVPRDFSDDFVPEPGGTLQAEVDLDGQPAFMVSEDSDLSQDVVAAVTYFSLDPRREAIAQATRTIVVQTLLVVALQLAGIAIATYLVVLRRLRRLGTSAQAVAEGDLDQHLPEGDEPSGRDELVNVAREFDKMISAVRARTVDLERAAEREREDAEQLRELDRVKNLLLRAVSHDLRSPITSVLGSARMLERADELNLSQEDRETLAKGLSSSARKMNRLVEDILDIDRLERGIIAPRRRMTDLAALVSEVARDAAVAGTHELHVESAPVNIAVDAPRVERIVHNLVSNAMKYTPRGTDIWVRVGPIPGGALLVVEDAGPGVADQIKEAIFEPFTQGDPEARVPGVGVGLSLVARFAELHGGRAWVEDREGGGASFHVELADGPEDDDDDDDDDLRPEY